MLFMRCWNTFRCKWALEVFQVERKRKRQLPPLLPHDQRGGPHFATFAAADEAETLGGSGFHGDTVLANT